MDKNDFAYCGLNCASCKEQFADIRNRVGELDEIFEKLNVEGMAKVIPFMYSKYKGYKKFTGFFKEECPGCREGGGNPFCAIRKCATKKIEKGYQSCVECDTDMCGKFKTILKVHTDNEIQNNRPIIQKLL